METEPDGHSSRETAACGMTYGGPACGIIQKIWAFCPSRNLVALKRVNDLFAVCLPDEEAY